MSNTIELVFIPAPGIGHVPPTVELAKHIIQRNEHISISILIINLHTTQSNEINAYVVAESRDNPYPTRLTFTTLPTRPDLPHPVTSRNFPTVVELYKPVVKQFLDDRVRAGFPKPAGFVLDFFFTSMMDIADELRVPSYMFYTSGANTLNLILYAQSLADDHGVNVAAEFGEPEFSTVVPGFKNAVTSKVIPKAFQVDELMNRTMFYSRAREIRQMRGILLNSYVELELFTIQPLMLMNNGGDKKIPPVYPIGPILKLDNKKHDGGFDSDKDSVMRWLDDQAESSVVFLCFGSMGSFDEEQVKEIANGLDRSGYRFLWVLRKPRLQRAIPSSNDTFIEALPEGFMDRTANRGKIIGWAPQVEVLAHPSIGGFISHCGWNSVLESLWFGVPIATWPLYAEQQLNAFELVKELELAVEIRMDYKMDMITRKRNYLVTSEEVEEGVKKLMGMDNRIKDTVTKISKAGRNALEKGGSSYTSLDQFIEDVLNNA